MILKQVNFNNEIVDIKIENGKILKIAKNLSNDNRIIDCKGLTALPAFVDMHTHLREPGQEKKEDILSGTSAAVAGGYSAVCCMPNTLPVIDNKYMVEYLKLKAEKVAKCNVYPIGAITKDSKGKILAEMHKMKDAGIVAVSDDGNPVENGNIMKLAMQYAEDCNLLVISHCEDKALANGGVANEGYNATRLGLKPISKVAEELMVAREILLAENLNTKVHIAHISTINSVNLIRNAKFRGVKVSAETCPHYFSATDDLLEGYNTFAKVNPPLRSEEDKKAIIKGIQDGTIDAIATDHAPHTIADKNVEFDYAANGISGLETAFSLAYTNLVKTGKITLDKLVELMSINPSKLMGLKVNKIEENEVANITLIDLENKYKIDRTKFKSKGKNTPFDNWEVYGKVMYTIVNGKLKFEKGEVL